MLFEGFELLDVFGPVELLHVAGDLFEIEFLGPPGKALVPSSQGVEVRAQRGYDEASRPDIALLPGGIGTRKLVRDDAFLAWLRDFTSPAQIVASVCTGSAVLAAAGLSDGYRATSNKLAYGWATSHGANVSWVPQARWVEDRDRWTSSGVAAGMDMTAALIRHLHGEDVADEVTLFTELEVHRDPSWDPFAGRHGLVQFGPG